MTAIAPKNSLSGALWPAARVVEECGSGSAVSKTQHCQKDQPDQSRPESLLLASLVFAILCLCLGHCPHCLWPIPRPLEEAVGSRGPVSGTPRSGTPTCLVTRMLRRVRPRVLMCAGVRGRKHRWGIWIPKAQVVSCDIANESLFTPRRNAFRHCSAGS